MLGRNGLLDIGVVEKPRQHTQLTAPEPVSFRYRTCYQFNRMFVC
jgi:hypothetical protein